MIKTSVINQTGIIILNRPDKRNALNPELISDVLRQLSIFESDDEVRSIILSGEGKSFCAGADLEYLLGLTENTIIENRNDSSNIAEFFLRIYEFPKPVIAAVNGAAVAGGCGLASVCDYVVAHPRYAKFGYSEVKIGFIPAIVSVFLIRRIGESKARQLLLSGENVDAQRAVEIGLADYLSDDPVKKGLEIASGLHKNSSFSLTVTKRMIREAADMSIRDAVRYCTELNAISRSSEDFAAGIKSFLKK